MMESPEQKEIMRIKAQLQQRLEKAGIPADKIDLAISAFDEVSHDYIFIKKIEN